MSKLSYLRIRMEDEYKNRNLDEAAKLGHTIINEQLVTQTLGKAFSDDLYNLALVYDELNLLDKALELYSKSTHYLPDDDAMAVAIRANNMGGVFARMGSTHVAAHFYYRARAILKDEVGTEHPSYGDVLYNLSNLYAQANDEDGYDSVLRTHKQALKIRDKAGLHEDVLHSLHSIAFIYEEKGDEEQARFHARAAIIHASRHCADSDYISACNYFAQILESYGHHERALEMYSHVFDKIVATGCTRTTYADCLKTMAKISQKMGNIASAEEYMIRAIKARELDSKDKIDDICFLIRLYLQDDTYEKAVDMLVYALDDIGETDGKSVDAVIDALLDALAMAKDKPRLMEIIKKARDVDRIREVLSGFDEWDV